MVSNKQNSYFDIGIITSPKSSRKVRVMDSQEYNMDFFDDIHKSLSPIKMVQICPTESGRTFFNTKQGSRMKIVKTLDFEASDAEPLTVAEIKEIRPCYSL